MSRKRKRDFTFYWETPQQQEKLPREPFEFRFTFPKLRFPEMKDVAVDMAETNKDVVVKARLPGFRRDEINLDITEGTVGISASKHQEKIEKGAKYFRQEKKTGAIRRAFTLPAPVDPEKARASLEGDVLTIILPKTSERRKSRKVVIE